MWMQVIPIPIGNPIPMHISNGDYNIPRALTGFGPALVLNRCAGRLEQSSSGDQMHRRAFHLQASSESWAVLLSLTTFLFTFLSTRPSLTLNGSGFAFAVIRFYCGFTVFCCIFVYCWAPPFIFYMGRYSLQILSTVTFLRRYINASNQIVKIADPSNVNSSKQR